MAGRAVLGGEPYGAVTYLVRWLLSEWDSQFGLCLRSGLDLRELWADELVAVATSLHIEYNLVEKEYGEARSKLKGSVQQTSYELTKPDIRRAFQHSSTTEDAEGPVAGIPGLREQPLG